MIARIFQHQSAIALLITFFLCLPAHALDLGDAKARGLVGETTSGYLAAITASAEVNALVAHINALRKTSYQDIANKNGISLRAVEARAGEKAIAKTPPGQFINRGSGWEKK